MFHHGHQPNPWTLLIVMACLAAALIYGLVAVGIEIVYEVVKWVVSWFGA